jgi:hypothetical protein
MNENTATLLYSMHFVRYKPWNSIFIKKFDQLNSNGLVQKIDNNQNRKIREDKHSEDEKPRPLTMNHVGVCFAIIMVCLSLSCIVFAIEFIVGYNRD